LYAGRRLSHPMTFKFDFLKTVITIS
jgi:hypothetical protein